MPRLLRLAALAALGFCTPQIAPACSIVPPPPPPPQTATETDAEFEARSRKWYLDLAEQHQKAALPKVIANEDRLWRTADRVVLARLEKLRSTRLRSSEGGTFDSPLAILRPVRWLKGTSSAKRLKVHYLSNDSCLLGGAGDAPRGDVGEFFLLFYKPGSLTPRYIIDTIGSDRAVPPE